MADEAQTIQSINWREVFPFTHIFRSFRVAVHPSKLVLGLLLLLGLYVGGRVLDGLWPAASKANPGEIEAYEQYRWAHDQSATFAEHRDAQRQQNIEQYADLLVAANIEPNRSEALAAARAGRHKRRLDEAAVAARNEAIQRAFKEEGDALNAAASIESEPARHAAVRLAKEAYDVRVRAAERELVSARAQIRAILPRGIFDEFFTYEFHQADSVINGVLSSNWLGMGLRGMAGKSVVASIADFVVTGPGWLVSNHWFFFLLFGLWFLLLWAVFGGAIARIAAVHVARDEKISVRQALGFSLSKVLSFVFAPLIPLIIILAAGIAVAAGGLLFYIPWIGPIAAGALFFIALAAGFVMTLVGLGTVGGFNLMYPTVAVEGSDSFDAISRSFSYVFARPWRMIFYTAAALVYGAACYLFVRYFLYVMLAFTHYFASWWLGGQPGFYFPQIWPSPSDASLPYMIDFSALKWSEAIAAFLISFWVYLVISLLGAFAISFYFSANTIIYFLMRREVDATELDDVYVEETDEEFSETAPAAGRPFEAPAATAVSSTAAVAAPSGVVNLPVVENPPPTGPVSDPPMT